MPKNFDISSEERLYAWCALCLLQGAGEGYGLRLGFGVLAYRLCLIPMPRIQSPGIYAAKPESNNSNHFLGSIPRDSSAARKVMRHHASQSLEAYSGERTWLRLTKLQSRLGSWLHGL